MKVSSRSLVVIIIVASASAFYLYEAAKIPFGSIGMPGAGFMPVVIGVLLLVLCALLVVKELLLRRRTGENAPIDLWEEGDVSPDVVQRKALLLGGAFIVYAFAFSTVGFVVSTVLILWASLMVFEFRGWLVSFVIAAAMTAVGYMIFALWLDVQFPHGILY
jgi:hypothetical protein